MGFIGAKAARVWKHRRLQGDAEDRTPGECSGRKWRCVRETEKEFELRSVTRLSVTPQRRGAREPDDAIDLSGTTLDKLNGAIKARRKAAKRAEIEELLDAVARDVAASARTLVEEAQEPQDLVLAAKLEGSQIGTTFTLQRCFPFLGWRDIESWTATLKDAPKHVVARLSEVPAGAEGAAATRPDAWIGPLRTFLERAKPPIGFSPKAETSHAHGRLL